MNYEEKSETEINEMVAELHGGCAGNYCNNPSDAWPIIIENEISVIKCKNFADDWSAEKITDISDDDFNVFHCQSSHSYNDKNPLRAAMIVYLMMQEAKQ
jgi:hypothetical protein